MIHRKLLIVSSFFMLIITVLSGCSGGNPQMVTPTPGQEPVGSSVWGLGLAMPKIQAEIGTDAVVYQVYGGGVNKDGTIFTNTGSWGFTAWSATNQKEVMVTVDGQGNVSVTSGPDGNPPKTINGTPASAPTNLADSTIIFQALTQNVPGFQTGDLVTFNVYNSQLQPALGS